MKPLAAIPAELRTRDVCGVLDGMIESGDYAATPILLDAIRDAGGTEDHVLAVVRSLIYGVQKADAPRLWYADWLEERGEVERAEFIRVQVELARTPPLNIICRGCGKDIIVDERVCDGCVCNNPAGVNHGLVPQWVCLCSVCDPKLTGSVRLSPLRRREREAHPQGGIEDCLFADMLGVNIGRLTSPAAPSIRWEYRRGFIDSITISWSDFLRHHERLFWSPRQTVECSKCKGSGRAPFANEWQCWTCGKQGIRGAASGRIHRLFVPTAQPIETVWLTTWPANHNGRFSLAFSADDGSLFSRNSLEENLWRCDAWPGVDFVMPENH